MTFRGFLIWLALVLAIAAPVIAATQSPLLHWREPIYIIAGFSGIVGLALLLVQPVLISGALRSTPARRFHVWTGAALVLSVVIHVGGLWITSPPDVVDVLLFRSPTPFAIWGATAMWAVFAASLLAVFRKRVGLRVFRVGHSVTVAIVIVGSVIHSWLVQGAMENFTKGMLCLLVLGVGLWVLRKRQAWRVLR